MSATINTSPCVLRPPRPGDYGHIIQRHGELYAREMGFDEHFEALVAEIALEFIRQHDPRRERLWIADIADRPMGSVMLVAETDELARLRLFLVEPESRGLGIGKLLIEECLRFARSRGYQRITLSTVRQLAAARHLYERVGFRLVSEQEAHRWGVNVVNEEWLLDL